VTHCYSVLLSSSSYTISSVKWHIIMLIRHQRRAYGMANHFTLKVRGGMRSMARMWLHKLAAGIVAAW